MRVILEEADVIQILGKHFNRELTAKDIQVTTDPLEIHVSDVGVNHIVAEHQESAAEQLTAALLAVAKQEETVVSEDPEPKEYAEEDNEPLTMEQLLDPAYSKHADAPAPAAPKRAPMPPLPALDVFDDSSSDDADFIHFDDPGPTTPAEVEAARRQKGNG